MACCHEGRFGGPQLSSGNQVQPPHRLTSRLLQRLGALPDARRGHGLRHRQRFVVACAVVSTLMGACGYRAFENTSKKFTHRQLRALGCQPDEGNGLHDPPSDSTFQRVLNRLEAGRVATIMGC